MTDLKELRRLRAKVKRTGWSLEDGNSPEPEWLMTGADEFDMDEVRLAIAAVNALDDLLGIAEAAVADAADREPDSWCEPGGCQNCDRLRAALAEVAGG